MYVLSIYRGKKKLTDVYYIDGGYNCPLSEVIYQDILSLIIGVFAVLPSHMSTFSLKVDTSLLPTFDD